MDLKAEYPAVDSYVVASLRFSDFDMVFLDVDENSVNELRSIVKIEMTTPIVAICNSFEIGMEALKNGATNYILDPPCPIKLTEIIKQIRGG